MSMCAMNTLKLQLAPRAPCLTRNTTVQVRKMASAVRCSAQKESEQSILEKAKLPAIALLAAALMLAGSPDEALAARSGGRMGGSGFSSRPRSAPSMPRSSAGVAGGGGGVRNYNYYSAPPIISPYGFGGYGMGGGIGFFPVFGLGSLFNILIIMFFVNVALQTVRNFTNGSDDKNTRSEDDEDERW